MKKLYVADRSGNCHKIEMPIAFVDEGRLS
jgi:hypothetical protein